jgi:branched-chain amino acid transport system permease protein
MGLAVASETVEHVNLIIIGSLIIAILIIEPHGLSRLWSIGREKLRLWPFPH